MDKAAKATEFSIPASPAFNMLNENVPARIQRYASLHDFKVDWSMTNGQQGYSLSPGIAIEAQPVWILMFDRAGAQKYRVASPVMKTLSTLSLSVGTNSSNDKNWLAWGAKINLFRQNDPLADPAFIQSLEAATSTLTNEKLLKIGDLEKSKALLNSQEEDYADLLSALNDSIASMNAAIAEIKRGQPERIADARDAYIENHWNSAFLDLSFGRLLTFQQIDKSFSQTISNPATSLDTTLVFTQNSLELKNCGYGVWLSGGLPIGSSVMISGMARYGKRASPITAEIGQVFSAGANLRYGARRYNFFMEFFFDQNSDPLSDISNENLERKLYMLTFGGDWRISKNVMLSFGILQTRDFQSGVLFIQPLANVNCLMR
ncbi:MAG: hypothetical protein IPL65_11450 [Lewinellaceae bacterium]|nr:hypothetical protein [Lewinellaceae bacterium]